ncbi:Smr protein/MutS2 [Gemmatirosa kalamazoonensis]|uniref:Smr protein/MutS2 n=1 Tax=Gemmatirosa kalamazoonensis TaxID=861299 RepID=W0RCW6_9BACT|nr:Smr/MutS family protein [Gemmatirosa kalamazoonensis]AHG88964.1 Smr protein/MutS2 [Gemmatirosa kalamazoonensis]
MSRARKEGGARRVGVERAFDELAFGDGRTLNLRAHLPTRGEAVARTEAWLRERQATLQTGAEVLVITGRGNASADRVSVVRAGVSELLASLRRRHVVATYREHTAGSFVVELAPAAAAHAPRRALPNDAPAAPSPSTLAGLHADTRKLLRDLARIGLQHLGVHSPTRRIVEDEMLRQFTALAERLPDDADREAALREEIERAIHALEA